MFDLSGQVAIVTGSSRGIGRATAEALAAAGARVVVSSRTAEACEGTADSIHAAGGEARIVPCNISDKDQLQKLVDKTLETFGRLDTLVCNAATNPVYGSMAQVDDAAFDKIINTNVRSNFWLCNLALPHMVEQLGGSIIIISSITGMAGSKNIGIYALSKAADLQLARNLAVEWGKDNITANCITPGLIKTDFAKALWDNPDARNYVEKLTPLGRIGQPEDIAGIAVFLASAAARFITGQSIVADGGVTIQDYF